jgi:hypothetical protein
MFQRYIMRFVKAPVAVLALALTVFDGSALAQNNTCSQTDLDKECARIQASPGTADPSCMTYCSDCAGKIQSTISKVASAANTAMTQVNKIANVAANKLECAKGISSTIANVVNFGNEANSKCGKDVIKSASVAADAICTMLGCLSIDPAFAAASKELIIACEVGRQMQTVIQCWDYNVKYFQGAKSACKNSIIVNRPVNTQTCSVPTMIVPACQSNGSAKPLATIQSECSIATGNNRAIPAEQKGTCTRNCVSVATANAMTCRQNPTSTPTPTTSPTGICKPKCPAGFKETTPNLPSGCGCVRI